MRSTAEADGVQFDAAPPYRVKRTATMDGDVLRGLLEHVEQRLDRRVDERPRPHLVAAGPEVTRVGDRVEPGARHVALWVDGVYEQREELGRAIDARLAVDPYCTLDVVLVAKRSFPLDLVDFVRRLLDRGPASYLTRTLALRGEDLQRRIAVVVPEGAQLSPGWSDAAAELVPVFHDRSAQHALQHLDDGPVRIVGDVSPAQWTQLVARADADAVAFADRALEARWVRRALG